MARKFLLVPEDMYKSLLEKHDSKNKTAANPSATPLFDASVGYDNMASNPHNPCGSNLPPRLVSSQSGSYGEQLESKSRAMHDILYSDMDVGEKMVHYNNALFNYLRLKEELENKPIKVHVANQMPSGKGPSPTLRMPDTKPIKMENIVDEDDESYHPGPNLEEAKNDDIKDDDPFDQLLNIVNSNKDKFGVRANQLITDQGRLVSRSDVSHILKNLIDPYHRHGFPSIPGTELLRKRLLKNPLTQKFLVQKGSGLSGLYSKKIQKFHSWM